MKRLARCISLVVATAWAASVHLSAAVYTVSVPDYEANPGAVLQVPVTLDHAAGLAQIRLQLNYDSQVLTLMSVATGPLGAQFDFSHEAAGGTLTMDFVRATALESGAGRLAVVGFRVNDGATTDLYSDLAIARFDLGDASGVRNMAAQHELRTRNGSVRVSVSGNIDNQSNGLPDWWEQHYNLDLFSFPVTHDSDGDSLSDFLEYAFGGHPWIPDAATVEPVGSVQTFDGRRYLVLTFRRYKDAAGIGYVLQESANLAAWNSVDPNARLVSPPLALGNGMESVTVRGTQPTDGPDAPRRGFMRIGVEPAR